MHAMRATGAVHAMGAAGAMRATGAMHAVRATRAMHAVRKPGRSGRSCSATGEMQGPTLLQPRAPAPPPPPAAPCQPQPRARLQVSAPPGPCRRSLGLRSTPTWAGGCLPPAGSCPARPPEPGLRPPARPATPGDSCESVAGDSLAPSPG